MRNLRLLVALFTISLLAVGCGTAATPIPNSATRTAQETEAAAEAAHEEAEHDASEAEAVEDEEAVVEEATEAPTETPVPTATPLPPTPTEIPPTPTEEPQQAVDQVTRLVQAFGDPASGEQLFQQTFSTSLGDWACMQCHLVDSEAMLIGPGMLNLNQRAGERIEGQTAELYVYNSIIHPNDYIVETYPENVMPQNYAEVLTEQQLYDLAAYLLSLGD